MMAHGDAREGK